jgi:hypothetical protein
VWVPYGSSASSLRSGASHVNWLFSNFFFEKRAIAVLARAMQYTIWDPCWDSFLRRILVGFEITTRDKLALWNARCTTVESAKTLTMTSPALQIIPEETRQQFLQAVDDAEVLCKLHRFVNRKSSNDDDVRRSLLNEEVALDAD